MTDPTPDKQTNFQGSVTGTAMDGGTVNAENIAGRDINIHNHPAPVVEKPTFPIHEIAHLQNPNFTGREEILQQVAATLNAGQTAVMTQTIAGLGGVGKTQVALAYCYANLHTYDLIYWLNADSEPGLSEGLMALTRHLKLIAPNVTDQQAARQTLLHWLGQTNQRWLLVYDNADQIEPAQLTTYLPRTGNGHVLITSRNPNYDGVGKVLELGLFTLDEAVEFLLQRRGAETQRKSKERDEAAALAEELGRFPLALEHAAAYVGSKGSSYAAYHRLFANRWAELWIRAEAPDSYHATITTTWKLAFDEVKKTPGALDLLSLCCFLQPESIPLDLIKQTANVKTQYSASLQTMVEDDLALDDAIGALRRYSLIQRTEDVLSLHQLVQLVIRNSLNQSSKELFASLISHTFNMILKEKKALSSSPFLSHLSFLITTILTSKKVLTDEFIKSSTEVEELILHVKVYLGIQAMNLEQIKSLQSEFNVLTDKLIILDERFSSFPNSSFHRFLLSDFQKQYREIQDGLNKSLTNIQNSEIFDIPNVFVKSEHVESITELLKETDARLRQIKTVSYGLDDLAAKLPCINQDLPINEIGQGLDRLETAWGFFNTAILAYQEGKYAELARLLQQATVIFEDLLGADHPATVNSRKIIAVVEDAFRRGCAD